MLTGGEAQLSISEISTNPRQLHKRKSHLPTNGSYLVHSIWDIRGAYCFWDDSGKAVTVMSAVTLNCYEFSFDLGQVDLSILITSSFNRTTSPPVPRDGRWMFWESSSQTASFHWWGVISTAERSYMVRFSPYGKIYKITSTDTGHAHWTNSNLK